jgi:transcriptional regulator GlxA family with amidase domain
MNSTVLSVQRSDQQNIHRYRVGFDAPGDNPDLVWVRPLNLGERAVRRAIAFVHDNLGERFTSDELASIAGISRFHMVRLFRVATGCSPMEYHMRQRVERSKQLLMRNDVPMCEIAATLGFCDQSHFTRTFRRVAGMSPGQYARSVAGLREVMK